MERHDGFLEVKADQDATPLLETLRALSDAKQVDLFADGTNLQFEKFHPYLPRELLTQAVTPVETKGSEQ